MTVDRNLKLRLKTTIRLSGGNVPSGQAGQWTEYPGQVWSGLPWWVNTSYEMIKCVGQPPARPGQPASHKT